MKRIKLMIRLIYIIGLICYACAFAGCLLFVYLLLYGHVGGLLPTMMFANLFLIVGLYCQWRYGKMKGFIV